MNRRPSLFAGSLALAAVLALAVVLALAARDVAACPFCPVVKPTLSQQRETAAAAAIASVVASDGNHRYVLKMHRVVSGDLKLAPGATCRVPSDSQIQAGTSVIALGHRQRQVATDSKPGGSDTTQAVDPATLQWKLIPATEIGLAYFAAAPSLRTASHERLAYFARYLEHRDATVAEDAFAEFAAAPFDAVAKAARHLPQEKLRAWLTDENVLPQRKGFYALAIGLAPEASARRTGAALLTAIAAKPADDFRAGFDGILGGILVASGTEGLDWIETRFLADPKAADGDLRHVASALRFYHEYGDQIPIARLRRAMRRLLARPEFVPVTIADLARSGDWEATAQVVAQYDRPKCPQPQTRHAVVGYLMAADSREARQALDRLAHRDPQGVAAAKNAMSDLESTDR